VNLLHAPFRSCRAALLCLLACVAVIPTPIAFASDATETGHDSILLRRRVVATADQPVARAAPFPTRERRLQLVQFAATPTDADLDDLRASGARIVQYVPHHAYLVWTSDDRQVEALAPARRRSVRFRTSFQPTDALAPELDSRTDDDTYADVTIQLAAGTARTAADLEQILEFADAVLVPAYEAVHGKFVNVRIRTAGTSLAEIAALDTVVNVEPFVRPSLLGERQGQILANDLNPAQSGPAAPGYLGFLAAAGFSNDPADYPVVVVVDDGVDNGTTLPLAADLYEFGSKSNASRMMFSVLPPGSAAPNPSGPDGHGTINASIVGGYNVGSGAAVEDAAGYNHGLGIAPFGRLANVRIFAPDFDIGAGNPEMISDYYARGARISANSWGADVNGAYNSMAQEYDALSRDAQSGTPGNQQLLFVFAAGNDGPGSGSIGSPGTAKNVISVGASETSNPAASVGSGCGDDASDGDDVRDLSSFSSRGPCTDSRMKPDIVAPGTFIHGLASQPEFNGSGVCGPTGNNFAAPGTDALFPAGSQYTWSSGTSHSTPAIAGAASLAHEFVARVYGIANPSPAFTKAYLLHGAQHMTGALANESLPGRHQGFGRADLDFIFDHEPSRLLRDQDVVLSTPGETHEIVGDVASADRPVRVVLAWTDPPGATFGSAFVNDLNLIVEVDGEVYRGNNFVGDVSQPGGTADTRNNVEAVFLPAGTTGLMHVKVEAITLASDGVPGTADPTDQDFALVVYNFSDVTSRGAIYLDSGSYRCATTLRVTTTDSDLQASGTLAITVAATSGDDESLVLTESPPASGVFIGTIASAAGAPQADAVLQLAHGDVVTATYDDADDGSGAPATVIDTASVDCIAPQANDVAAVAVNGSEVSITFTSDEPATAQVRYGTSCGDLAFSSSGDLFGTAHEVGIDGLMPTSTYYFVVEVTDEAGNLTIADNGGICFSVTTPERTTYFAEQFFANFDLSNTTLAFVPDGSVHFYTACRSSAFAFPTDPTGGTVLSLSDDSFVEVPLLDGKEVSIYGQTADSLFIDSNGYVGFVGDSDWSESFFEHFANPRVAALYDDLNPATGGTISVKQLDDRVAVTYANVPEYLNVGANSFQIEMFFDGRIFVTYLAISAADGLAGLSGGGGQPADFEAVDLSEADPCSSSAGSIALDDSFYACGSDLTLGVADADLAGTPQITVVVTTSAGDQEAVSLTESPPTTGSFVGTLLSTSAAVAPEDGDLQVGGGDTIIATYEDADDGTGEPRSIVVTARALCVDPFLLYQAARSSSAERFRAFAPVEMTDAFRITDYKILKIDKLGTPAQIDGAPLIDGSTHLREYKIKENTGEPRFPGAEDIRVSNRCGSVFVAAQRAINVLIPAGYDPGNPVPAPAEIEHRLDAFVCYKAKVQRRLANGNSVPGLPKGIQMDVVDDLNGGATRRYDLKKITRLCRPVAIDGAPLWIAGPNSGEAKPIAASSVRSPEQNLVCYAAKPARKNIAQDGCGPLDPSDRGTLINPAQPRHLRQDGLHTNDAFGDTIAKTTKEKEICLPSIIE